MFSFKAVSAGAIGALALMLTLTSPPSTNAQQAGAPKAKGAGLAACRTDMATFCKGIEAGRGQRIRCLVQNEAKLQPDCRAVVQDRMEKRAERRQAAPVPQTPGTGPLAAAPKETVPPSAAPTPSAPQGSSSAAQTTSAPPAAMPPAKGPAAAGRAANGPGPMAACRDDVRALCADVQPGGGARIRCLAEQSAKVSPGCQDALIALKQRRAEKKGG